LATKIEQLLGDERLYEQLAQAGRAFVEHYCSFTPFVTSLEKGLQEASAR